MTLVTSPLQRPVTRFHVLLSFGLAACLTFVGASDAHADEEVSAGPLVTELDAPDDGTAEADAAETDADAASDESVSAGDAAESDAAETDAAEGDAAEADADTTDDHEEGEEDEHAETTAWTNDTSDPNYTGELVALGVITTLGVGGGIAYLVGAGSTNRELQDVQGSSLFDDDQRIVLEQTRNTQRVLGYTLLSVGVVSAAGFTYLLVKQSQRGSSELVAAPIPMRGGGGAFVRIRW